MTIQGFDVVVINYRGLASAPLTTPRLYTANGWEDVLEPMKYIYEKYCRPHNRKAFAMGCSMGAGILGNLLGHEGENTFLEAATFVNPPMKLLICESSIRNSMFGAYNTALGKNLEQNLINNEKELNPTFTEKVGMDIRTYLRTHQSNILNFDNDITCPFNGWKDRAEYYDLASSCHTVSGIKIPCFYLSANDDPVVHHTAVDHEGISNNPNTVIATTNHGGHLGYRESICDHEQWFIKVCGAFYSVFQKRDEEDKFCD